MSAMIARQGGRIQLEQSNMCLAMNMATVANGGISSAAMQESQYLIN